MKKKKKGFTLIELVIVLAVLAIIALIAIPNFNKVRTDSQTKADLRTCEVIENVTTMAIANQDMTVTATTSFVLTPKSGTGVTAPTNAITSLTWGTGGKDNYEGSLSEVSKPQEKNKATYNVAITVTGGVEVVKVTTVDKVS